MTSSTNKTKKPSWSIKSISISIISFLVFSICFIPILIAGKILLYFISFQKTWHFLLLPFILYIGIAITVISLIMISGTIIRSFNIKYKPGKYDYTYKNKNAFRWIVVCSLYTPCRKLLEMFPMGWIKNFYYKSLGMKIGKNTLVGGVIKDPCLTEFGDNVTMGEYSCVYGHIHNMEKETIEMKKVIVGNNCVIGAGAFIMPGAVLEDDVIVAAGAVVIKDQVLKKGNIYAGVPAKEIKKKT